MQPLPFHPLTHLAWMRTRFAAERTLMSWNRVALTLIGFGFTIWQFFRLPHDSAALHLTPQAAGTGAIGIFFVLAGTVGTLIALGQYLFYLGYLHGEEFAPNGLLPGQRDAYLALAVAGFSALIGIATTLWILSVG
jgi:putative membrane protein